MSTNSQNDGKPASNAPPTFFDKADNSNTMTFAPTRTGMSGHYDALRLTDEEIATIVSKKPE